MLQVWWTSPDQDGRRAVEERLLAEPHPLYLPAGLPLLRQTVRSIGSRGQRVEAQVFARFLDRTFATACREWRAVGPTEQRLILGALLGSLDLPELDPIREKPGLVAAALRILRELKEAGVERSRWADCLGPGKGAAHARLAVAYQEFLEARHLADREDQLRMAAAALAADGPAEKPSLVLIEGFAALNALERSAIAALGAHVPVLLVVTYDPDRSQPTVASLGDWWAGATRAPGAVIPPPAVSFVEAPDPARELAQVARAIKQLLLEGRCQPDEIAIVSRRPEQARELVRRTLGRYGVPVSLPPEPLISAPVVQALLDLVRMDLDGALKSPYLSGDPQALAAAAAALRAAPGIAELCAALARLLADLGVERRILDLMHAAGPLDGEAAALGARQLSAYRGFLRVLVRMEQTYRQAELPVAAGPDRFLALLTEELSEATYHSQPRVPGPAVRFLAPAQVEGLRVPVIFAVGLAEGAFPTARAEDWVLPDRRRRAYPGLMTRDRHRQMERLQFLRVVRAAADRLILSRSTSEGVCSVFWEEMLAAAGRTEPDLKLSGALVAPGHFDQVASQDELLQRLVQVVRHGSPDPREQGLASRLAPHVPQDLADRIHVEDQRQTPAFTAWEGRLTDPNVLAQLAARLGGGHRFSASELETYAACPFRYLGERLVRLPEEAEDELDLDAREVGSTLHRVLAEFYRTPDLDLLSPAAEARLTELVRRETAGVLAGLQPALAEAWRRQFHRQAVAWLAAEREVKAKALAGAPAEEQLTPTYLEWSFGQKVRPGSDPRSTTEPLSLGGHRVAGVVDRIDLDGQGGYTVYDYKSGKSPTVGDILERRIRLQIPLYLLAARRLGLPGASRPLGGAYYGLRDRKRTGGIWRKSKKAVHGVTYSRCQLEDAEFETALAELETHVAGLMDSLLGGDLTVNPRVDCPKYCPMRTACRFAGKEGADQ